MDIKEQLKDIPINQGFGREWEIGLNQITQAGYSYGYVSYIDTLTGEKFFLVDAIKGDGPRIAITKPTMAKAVQELMRLLNLKDE